MDSPSHSFPIYSFSPSTLLLIFRDVTNEELSNEGNYSWTVSQANPRVVRRNETNGGNDGHGCKYKDLMASKQPSLSGSLTLVEVMKWISEMDLVFGSCD